MSDAEQGPKRRRKPPKGASSAASKRLLRDIETSVRDHVAGDRVAETRLRRYLTEELPAMKQDRAMTIRIPGALANRINALVPLIAADPVVTAARGGRGGGMSAVVRMALVEGIAALEERYGSQ